MLNLLTHPKATLEVCMFVHPLRQWT